MDSIAYRRLQTVPLNIVLYNVFSGPGRGPNIFGTEPWSYYAFNLILLFNIAAVAAFASLPLAVQRISRKSLMMILDHRSFSSPRPADCS